MSRKTVQWFKIFFGRKIRVPEDVKEEKRIFIKLHLRDGRKHRVVFIRWNFYEIGVTGPIQEVII